jgi:hypothetical protein
VTDLKRNVFLLQESEQWFDIGECNIRDSLLQSVAQFWSQSFIEISDKPLIYQLCKQHQWHIFVGHNFHLAQERAIEHFLAFQA